MRAPIPTSISQSTVVLGPILCTLQDTTQPQTVQLCEQLGLDFNGFNDYQELAGPSAPLFDFHSTQHLQPPPKEELIVHVVSTLTQYLIDRIPVDILSDGNKDIQRVTDSEESDIGLFSIALNLIQVLNYNQSIHQTITTKTQEG